MYLDINYRENPGDIMQQPGISLKLTSKKKKERRKEKEGDNDLSAAFGGDESTHSQEEHTNETRRESLAIPVAADNLQQRLQRSKDPGATLAVADAEAADALISDPNKPTSSSQTRTVQSQSNTNMSETQQFRRDLQDLPDEMAPDDYRNVPIADFGAALLRGMGWQGTANDNDDAPSLPRPQRLGLGATPKTMGEHVPSHGRRRPRRPEDRQRDKLLAEQKQDYQRQREQQTAADKQRRLQNESIVYLQDGKKRARIVQLVGVPGLNLVKVLVEGDRSPSVVKRGEVGDLVDRSDLERRSFRDATLAMTEKADAEESANGDTEVLADRKKSRKREKEDDDDPGHTKSFKKSKREDKPDFREPTTSWAMPNIRVRVISEKLGRQHYKCKGIVLDVTRKGITVQLDDALLDRVPEHYLETALPKAGGNVIVLTGVHQHQKGELLERDSRGDRGVVQLYEDMSVHTLSLDDMAEWCGPLDDDLAT